MIPSLNNATHTATAANATVATSTALLLLLKKWFNLRINIYIYWSVSVVNWHVSLLSCYVLWVDLSQVHD